MFAPIQLPRTSVCLSHATHFLRRLSSSEPVPKPNNGPVKIVVGRSFYDIAADETKDVFINMYAPWCYHCQQVEPTWKTLGKHFAKNKDVVIAKFNAEANDVPPETPLQTYPKLYFRKKGESKFVLYEGPTELEAMVAYVEETAVSLEHVRAERAGESTAREEETVEDEKESVEEIKDELWVSWRKI